METVIGSSVSESAAQFLTSKRVSGCSSSTITIYETWLKRLISETDGRLDALSVQRFFAGLRERNLSANTIHQAFRSIKTYLRWCHAVGAIKENPLVGLSIRTPRTLPTVPTEAEFRSVLTCCRADSLGKRNRAMVLAMERRLAMHDERLWQSHILTSTAHPPLSIIQPPPALIGGDP